MDLILRKIFFVTFKDIQDQCGMEIFDQFYYWLQKDESNFMPFDLQLNYMRCCDMDHFQKFVDENKLPITLRLTE